MGDIQMRLVIDCTVCPIERPSDNMVQRLFFSGKHKMHCVKYEVAVRPDGIICWINGPHQGSMADITVYREERIEDDLQQGELILGDKGYVGEARIITPKKKPAGRDLSEDEQAFNALINEKRIIVENCFAMVKSFRSMSTPWRQKLERHKYVFYVVCELANMKRLEVAVYPSKTWFYRKSNDLSADEGMQYCTMRNNFPPFDGGRGIYSVFRRLLDLGEWTKDQKERV